MTAISEDLRWIAGNVEVLKVESEQLRAIPAWVRELANLRSLAVGADLDGFEYANVVFREIPASIGELGALRELRLQGLANVEELPEGMTTSSSTSSPLAFSQFSTGVECERCQGG